ncbi:MAG: hypothetical protein VKI81_04950, partial [Synechococcaceae cyanobacterium]|nr:hypothetical protein [Synechococcaceae cyanobacterium]
MLARTSGNLEVEMEPALLSRACWLPRSWGGVALFGSVLMSLPLSAHHLAQLQALNRELGKLCSNPPHQALTICQLHARLVSS